MINVECWTNTYQCIASPYFTLIFNFKSLCLRLFLRRKIFFNVFQVVAKTLIWSVGIVNVGSCCRRCGQVSAPTQISSAKNYMGWRGDSVLFQRKIKKLLEGDV